MWSIKSVSMLTDNIASHFVGDVYILEKLLISDDTEVECYLLVHLLPANHAEEQCLVPFRTYWKH